MAASTRPSVRIRPYAVGRTDVGLLRVRNEDQLLVSPELRLFVVADGMGGTKAGDVAAELAVRTIEHCFTSDPLVGSDRDFWHVDLGLDHGARRLASAIRCANREVFESSGRFFDHHGMGSTVVALHVCPDEHSVHVAHVGDSRCYLYREGSFVQLTRDHSLVNEARWMAPHMDAAQIARLPRNIVSRALGLGSNVRVDVRTERARPGDVYMLCSDGLSGMLNDKQMLDVLRCTDDLDEACQLLVIRANEHGGHDNVTAVLVRIDAEVGPAVMIDPDGGSYGLDDFLLEHATSGASSMRDSHRRFIEQGSRLCTRCGARSPQEALHCAQCGARI
jgi:protein phosphatase